MLRFVSGFERCVTRSQVLGLGLRSLKQKFLRKIKTNLETNIFCYCCNSPAMIRSCCDNNWFELTLSVSFVSVTIELAPSKSTNNASLKFKQTKRQSLQNTLNGLILNCGLELPRRWRSFVQKHLVEFLLVCSQLIYYIGSPLLFQIGSWNGKRGLFSEKIFNVYFFNN